MMEVPLFSVAVGPREGWYRSPKKTCVEGLNFRGVLISVKKDPLERCC